MSVIYAEKERLSARTWYGVSWCAKCRTMSRRVEIWSCCAAKARSPVTRSRAPVLGKSWARARWLIAAYWLSWNNFVMVARVSTLVGLIRVAMPELFASFTKIRDLAWHGARTGGPERLYKRIPTASFSDEVLERYPINLGVLSVQASSGATSASPSWSWPLCQAWEFIPNGCLAVPGFWLRERFWVKDLS
jgi:hypothetical protein